MALTKPNQELCRDLKSASRALEEAAHELLGAAKQCSEIELKVAMQKIEMLHRLADRLIAHADKVKAGRIAHDPEMGSWPDGDI
ncbi:hypothetical protein LJR277_003363 [Pseudomonas sp. LjRoot277]|uniref:hypothetical protein n=1 Tax=Pseudomonas sp. LjRoot277 TaxID=3342307 RepID=UPI003ECE2840